MQSYQLGDSFMLGTATASAQIEGGDRNNTWFEWCESGHILDNTSCITACDHWNRVTEDTALLKALNVQTHRLSLEWSRIEPKPGEFSKEALKHYRDEIMLLLSNEIKPLVTLHHFSEPIWFEKLGGWKKPENTKLFVEYVRFVVENLGDVVSEWVTFNEPNVYAFMGYAFGIFPPGRRNLFDCLAVLKAMIKTHTELYGMIHQIRSDKGYRGATKVGVANHIRIFDGVTGLGKKTAHVVDYFFNTLAIEGMTTGRLRLPMLGWDSGIKKGIYADFMGLNYYTRSVVEFVLSPSNYFYKECCDKNLEKTDLGWDIYPKGIYRVCKRYYEAYNLPIYITENGISDKLDNRRPEFIVNHLAYLARAMTEGVTVERYYHWTLMDNFEWLNGQEGFFGLYKCNFKTQERTPRKSGPLYAQICSSRAFQADISKLPAE